MAGRHHAVAGAVQDVEILQLAVERVSAFDGKQSGREPAIQPAAFQVGGEISGTLNHHETASRSARELMQAACLIQRPLGEAVPGCGRPAVYNCQPENVIVLVFVALNVQTVRALGGQGKHLQGDVAVGEAGNVNVPVSTAVQQVAAPQQRVGVKVGDGELFVQIERALGCRVGRLVHNFVLVFVDQTRDGDKKSHQDAQDQQNGWQRPSTHETSHDSNEAGF